MPDDDADQRDDPSRRGLLGTAGGLVGVFTAVGTITVAIAYAVLWNAYASFYGAFGLTPGDVGLSRERVLLSAGLAALFVIGLLLLFALPVAGGYLVMPSRLAVTRWFGPAGIMFGAIATAAAIVVPVHHGQAGFLFTVIGLAAWVFVAGAILAAVRWNFDRADHSWREIAYALGAVAASAGYLVLAFPVGGWLASSGLPAPAQGVLLGAPAAVTVVLLLTRWQPAWSVLRSAEEVREKPAPRRRLPIVVIAASVVAVLAVWGLGELSTWYRVQRDAGARAIELGYRDSDLFWLDPRIRPVFVHRLDPDRDPVGVCVDSPPYAASLIGQDADGWWVLLRALEDTDGFRARVVWLPRDTYAIDLAPMAVQPGSGDGGDPNSGESRPWRWPACPGGED